MSRKKSKKKKIQINWERLPLQYLTLFKMEEWKDEKYWIRMQAFTELIDTQVCIWSIYILNRNGCKMKETFYAPKFKNFNEKNGKRVQCSRQWEGW